MLWNISFDLEQYWWVGRRESARLNQVLQVESGLGKKRWKDNKDDDPFNLERIRVLEDEIQRYWKVLFILTI